MRPSKRTLDRLRERARLLGEKHTTLAERYLEEGVIMDEHPNIHFVDGALGRRPAVLGSGLDVWEIVEVAKDNGGSVADTASYLEIDPRLVETALRYYGAYRDEIDDWIERVHALNEREESTWRAARKRSLLEAAARRAPLARHRPAAAQPRPRRHRRRRAHRPTRTL